MFGLFGEGTRRCGWRWIPAWGIKPRLTQPRFLLRILPKKGRGVRFDPGLTYPSSQRHARQEAGGIERT
jgi:hypothetical protein